MQIYEEMISQKRGVFPPCLTIRTDFFFFYYFVIHLFGLHLFEKTLKRIFRVLQSRCFLFIGIPNVYVYLIRGYNNLEGIFHFCIFRIDYFHSWITYWKKLIQCRSSCSKSCSHGPKSSPDSRESSKHRKMSIENHLLMEKPMPSYGRTQLTTHTHTHKHTVTLRYTDMVTAT